MVQQMRASGDLDRTRHRGEGGRRGLALLLLVIAGAVAVGWFLRAGGEKQAGSSDDAPAYEPASDAKWIIEMHAVRSTQGFTVIPLRPSDLANATELEQMFVARRENTPVMFPPDRFQATLTTLRALLPAGHSDPFGYGVAWSWNGIPYELEAAPVEVL
ncbi:MAG TPA: hypothetical protein VI997_10035 [Candidatus Thermoplasmatota archaeon]|nr:hypothetical protein [Candidatus Thermoplasmatota archaeon]